MRFPEFAIRVVEIAALACGVKFAYDLSQQIAPTTPGTSPRVENFCPPREGCVLGIDQVQEQIAEDAARQDAITAQIVGPLQKLFERAIGADTDATVAQSPKP